MLLHVYNEGRSGASVKRIDEQIIKTCTNAKEQFQWLKLARERGFPVPDVFTLSPGSYSMQHVSRVPVPENYAELIETVLNKFKQEPNEAYPFSTYLKYVMRNITDKKHKYSIARCFTKAERREYEAQRSWCHGDMTLSNIIWNGTDPILIDPSYKTGMWQSYLIDVGRLMQSYSECWEIRYLEHREPTVAEAALAVKNTERLYREFGERCCKQMLLLIMLRVQPFLTREHEVKQINECINKLIQYLSEFKN